MKIRLAPITVPIRYIRGMVRAAVANGTPQEEVLAWAGGVNAAMLDAPRARVSLKQFSRLYGAVAQRLEDEGAGLSSFAIPLGAVETMLRVGITANSLAECAEFLAKSLNAILHEVRVTCSVDDAGINIVLTGLRQMEADRSATYEVILLTAYSTMAWLFGRRLPLAIVDFPSAVPRHLFELRTLFAARLRFNQPSAALRFSGELESLRVVREPAEIPKFLRRAPSSLIEALLERGRLTLDVRKCIYANLPTQLSLKDVAARLALSPRSLHRKLELEGASFQQTKDDLRRDMAIHALTRTDKPIKQISLDMGFADQASFQRAFAQWTGRPPGAWRRVSASAR